MFQAEFEKLQLQNIEKTVVPTLRYVDIGLFQTPSLTCWDVGRRERLNDV